MPAPIAIPNARSRVAPAASAAGWRSEEHTSELQSQSNLVCRLLLEKQKLGRTVGLRVAVLHYFVNVNPQPTRPRIIYPSLPRRSDPASTIQPRAGQWYARPVLAALS